MDMDIDLEDFDFSDRVKGFLDHKLKEFKNLNNSIESKIKERQEHLRQVIQTQNTSKDTELCTVMFNWKKIFNNKFIICFNVQNKLDNSLENLKLLLKFPSPRPLTYDVSIYDIGKNKETKCSNDDSCQTVIENLVKSNSIISEGYIILVIKNMTFLDSLDYSITGKLFGKSNGREILINMPVLNITAKDMTSKDLCVSPSEANIENLFSIMLSSEQTNLVCILPSEMNVSIDSLFEIDCSLLKMSFSESCKMFFVANRLSHNLNGSLIELHKSDLKSTFWTTVYSSSRDSLYILLHHLHQHIPGLIILPRKIYEEYMLKNINLDQVSISEILREFQDKINKEVELIESFTQSGSNKNVQKFRLELLNLEAETDLFYLKICELNKINII